MIALPIDAALPEIIARLREARSAVIVAEPGAGKTTRVPPALLSAPGLLDPKHPGVVMLQPRRVAARAAAERIADERGWTLGREVGYHVRFDRKVTRDTRLRVVTEGILTRQLLDDPFLEDIGAVILDEFHERSIHTDIAVALLREVRSSVRDDLLLIVMSATLEAEPVARFLGDAPIVNVPGRTFPVEIAHEAKLGTHLVDQIVDKVESIARSGEIGDVLVFLPGAAEIGRAIRQLEPLAASQNLVLLPLHGSLPADEQTRALRPVPAGRRKVICATNIAETSLTIDGVRFVIDSGLARVAGFDPRRGLDRLELKRISKASAVQRAGRAGRTAPGRCVRLWSQREFNDSPDFDVPEISRVDLCGTVLAMHAWGHPDPRKFPWYDAPPEHTIASAERLLAMLGALDSPANGRLTEIGRRVLPLPVHPRLARLLVAATDAGLLREGAGIAAILSEKDFLHNEAGGEADGRQPDVGPISRGSSDVLFRLELLDSRHEHDSSVHRAGFRQVLRIRDELIRIGRRISNGAEARAGRAAEDELLKLVLLAYPDRVARRRSSTTATMVGGSGVRLGKRSVVHDWEFFIAADARHDERNPAQEAVVRMASGIRPEWLEELFPHAIRRDQRAAFDEARGKVVGLSVVLYHDLVLRETRDSAVDPEAAARVLADSLRDRARAVFEQNEVAADLLKRVRFLRRHMPEHPWPALDDAELAELLAEASAGRRSVDEIVRGGDLVGLLRSRLLYPLDRLLDQHAPRELPVPTGRSLKVEYSTSGETAPVLAVRLQELFGMTDTPRLAGGRVPLVLHLLGPNYRPVQITDDLRSFWSTTYFQVRKDLRVRYPKHSWPENPLTAKPEAKGVRRKPE